MTPAEVKMALEMKASELAVTITGVHSVVLIEDTVDVIFDISPDPDESGLQFVFPLPPLVNRDDVREFAVWLCSRCGDTIH